VDIRGFTNLRKYRLKKTEIERGSREKIKKSLDFFRGGAGCFQLNLKKSLILSLIVGDGL